MGCWPSEGQKPTIPAENADSKADAIHAPDRKLPELMEFLILVTSMKDHSVVFQAISMRQALSKQMQRRTVNEKTDSTTS